MRYYYKMLQASRKPNAWVISLEEQIVGWSQEGFRVHTIDFTEGFVLMERCKETETE